MTAFPEPSRDRPRFHAVLPRFHSATPGADATRVSTGNLAGFRQLHWQRWARDFSL